MEQRPHFQTLTIDLSVFDKAIKYAMQYENLIDTKNKLS